MIAMVMGVSGSGKTTVAARLAKAVGCRFQEGDGLHSPAKVEKMGGGASGVITCSVLKRRYREIVVGNWSDMPLVYLRGSHDLIRRRMAARRGHFMPAELLNGQFGALEEPIVVDIDGRPADIAGEIFRQLDARRGRVGGDDSAALTARPSEPSAGEQA